MEKEILYIYIRVSTDEQKLKDLSLPRQKELGIQQANELGMTPKIYEEAGESASYDNFDNRPELVKLLNLIKEGKVKNLYVWDSSRLSRNNLTKAILSEEFRKADVFVYTHSKDYDFNKVEDVLTFNILQALETYESSLRKARFQLGYVSGNKKGRYLKGIPPYGYKKDLDKVLIVDEEEKEVFLKIVDMYLNKGFGTNQIANWLNKNFIPTKTSKIYKNGYKLNTGSANRKKTTHKLTNHWNPGTINTMLKSELYYGRRRFKVGKDSFDFVKLEPLISKETFEKINQRRIANSISWKKEDKYFYHLKNILTCGNCGQPFHGRVKPNRGEYAYRCNSKRETNSTCEGRGINIVKLNNIVWNAFKSSAFYHKLINQKILAQLNDDNGLSKQLEVLHQELAQIQKSENRMDDKMKELVKKEIDKRIKKKLYEEIMTEMELESKTISDNKMLCLANIKMFTQQLNEKINVESEVVKGLTVFKNVQEEIESLYPGDLPEEQIKICDGNKKIRLILRNAIKNVNVHYNTNTKKYTIEIIFNKVGVKNIFEQEHPDKFDEVAATKVVVGIKESVVIVKLPLVSKEYFLNSNSAFRKKYENEALKLNSKIKPERHKKNMPKPKTPLLIQEHPK